MRPRLMRGKGRGVVLTETLIAILLFLVGLLAILGLLTMGLKMMFRTENVIPADMAVNNLVEEKVMKLNSDPAADVSDQSTKVNGSSLALVLSDDISPDLTELDGVSIDRTAITVNCDLYRTGGSKAGTYFYYLKKGN